MKWPRLQWLVCLFVLLGNAGCRHTEKAAAEPPALPPSTYLRIASPATNQFELQIALRKLVPATGRGPVIWLAAVSHIGESNYFQALQRHLDAQDLVLFEGIGQHGARNKPSARKLAQSDVGSLQSTLAQALGLTFQLDAIDYSPDHFRNSDLSLAELQALLAREAPEPGEESASEVAGLGPIGANRNTGPGQRRFG
jgi:hypothetical protein